jgi:AcrR family transcriptional regulator
MMQVTESQPGVRLPRTRQARRERIVTAGFELLLAADYDSVQMRDVAERAGVALATVYRYFPSKEQLFGHVLMRWHEDRWQRLGGRSHGTSNRERLTDVALRTVAAYEKQPQFLMLKFRLEQSGDPAVSDYLDYIGRGSFRMFRAKLDGLTDDDAARIVFIVISVIMAEINGWVRDRRRVDQVRRQVSRTIELLLEFADPAYLQQRRTR